MEISKEDIYNWMKTKKNPVTWEEVFTHFKNQLMSETCNMMVEMKEEGTIKRVYPGYIVK